MLNQETIMEPSGFITKKLPCPCSEQRMIAITFPPIPSRKNFEYGFAQCGRKCECGKTIVGERYPDGTCEYRELVGLITTTIDTLLGKSTKKNCWSQ